MISVENLGVSNWHPKHFWHFWPKILMRAWPCDFKVSGYMWHKIITWAEVQLLQHLEHWNLPSTVCWCCLHPRAAPSGTMFLSKCRLHLAPGFSSCISSWNVCSQVLKSSGNSILRGVEAEAPGYSAAHCLPQIWERGNKEQFQFPGSFSFHFPVCL